MQVLFRLKKDLNTDILGRFIHRLLFFSSVDSLPYTYWQPNVIYFLVLYSCFLLYLLKNILADNRIIYHIVRHILQDCPLYQNLRSTTWAEERMKELGEGVIKWRKVLSYPPFAHSS